MRLSTSSVFYRSVKSNDSSGDRYVTFGSHATYAQNTGGVSIWAKRGTWRSDGENIFELYANASNYVRVGFNGRLISVAQNVGGSLVTNTTYSLSNNAIESWHSLVATWDSSSFDVYLDGTRVINSAGNKQCSWPSNPTFYVGTGNAAGSGFMFDGYHTRAAIYSAKLAQADVDKIVRTISPTSEVSAWDYTDVSGSTITLTRGAGNNGTLINSAINLDVPFRPRVKLKTTPSSIGLTTGKIESASNCGISGSTAWTMGGWIFINKINGGGSGYDFPFATMGATAPYLGLDKGVFSIGHTASINSSTIKAQQYLGQWVHLAGSYSGGTNGTYKIFLNGKQVYSTTYVGTPALANGKFAINNYLNSGLYQLYAQFSQVFCATSALTETEIYNLAYSISTPTLAVFWKLDEKLGTSATDSSGNSNTGTITSGTWSGLNVPFAERTKVQNYPYSVSFNGSTQYGAATINFGSATKLVWHGWIKPIDGDTAQVFLSSDISGQAFEIQYANALVGKRKYIGLVGVTGSYNYWESEEVVPGEWHRITFVYDSAEAATTRTKIYIDGRLSGKINTSTNVSPTLGNQAIELCARTAAGLYGKGNVGAFRMYTGYAWTADEVLKAHEQDIYPSSGTLIANIGMTDGNGTSLTDLSGNGNNISLVNTPTWTIDSPLNNRRSIRSFPYALQFVRASSTRSTIPYVNLGSSLSYSVWMRPRLNGNAGDIIGIMDTLVRISPTDIKFYTDGTSGFLASVAFNFENNKLYHLGVTCSGTTVKFYINGTLLGTQTASGAVDTSSTSNFIGYYGIAPQAFEGEMAEVAAWSRTLTDADMANIYFRNIVSTTNLERYYKFATGSGTTATDSSVNAQNGTITAGTWTTGLFGSRSTVS